MEEKEKKKEEEEEEQISVVALDGIINYIKMLCVKQWRDGSFSESAVKSNDTTTQTRVVIRIRMVDSCENASDWTSKSSQEEI